MSVSAHLLYHRFEQPLREPIGDARLRIGRTEKNAIQLGGDGVSREHCWVANEAGAYVVVDLGSSNGTFLNGVRLTPHDRHRLGPGDVLQIGEHTLTFEGAAPVDDAEQVAPGRAQESLALLLETIADLHQHLEPATVLPAIVDRVIRLTGAERGLLQLKGGDGLETSVARTRDGEDIERVDGISHSVPQSVLESGVGVCVTGGDDWSQASKSMREHELRSILCVPIRQRGSVRGVIYVDSQEVQVAFGDHERLLLEALAAQCAIALERAQVHQREVGARLRLEEENAALKRDGVARPLAVSEGMLEALRKIERVAGSDLSLLLTGETGVGKEVLAHYAHDVSHRRDGPFVVVDCGAIPEALLESVLFGHVQGAFTSATADSPGLVRRAHGGTLQLDEVGELPLALQPKLLRFLEERTFLPVGSGERQQVDVRVVACTHRDLEGMVADGTFREDLFFRLNAYPVQIPPLRERRRDIVPLARLLLSQARRTADAPLLSGFTHEAEAALEACSWPGNVRELAHRIQRAAVVAEPPFVTVSDLDLAAAPDGAAGELPLKEARKRANARFEREYVTELLGRHQGRVQLAAKEAGVSRQMFQRLMARHGISRKTFQ